MPAHFQFAHSSGSKSKLGLEDETEARASSPTLSPIRSPLTKRTMNQGNDLEAQLKQLQTRLPAARDSQQHTRPGLEGRNVGSVRRKPKRTSLMSRVLPIKSANLQRSRTMLFTTQQNSSESWWNRKHCVRRTIRNWNQIQSRSRSSRMSTVASQQVLKDVLESNKSQHARELSALQQEYDLVCLGRDAAEEAARWKRTELEAIELSVACLRRSNRPGLLLEQPTI